MTLHDIGMRHGTDKATYHKFLDLYESHIDPSKVKRLLEIGIYQGASLRMWREWLPDTAIVEGWDINPHPPIDGCDLRVVDQLDVDAMLANVTGMYDVIIDDGGHTARMMQTSFATLFPHTRLYIIEDLHAPWCGDGYMEPGDHNTLHMVQNLDEFGWTSQYCTEQQRAYIDANAELEGAMLTLKDGNPSSATCVIRNKRNV